ncbi:MAG: DUF3310 domain-containing protein [Eubacterium sp.]
MSDSVRHPKHYDLEGLEGIESIDIIKSVLGSYKFEGFCRGNVLKYVIRADHKGGLEDLRKAQVYLGWEIETREKRVDELDEILVETRKEMEDALEDPEQDESAEAEQAKEDPEPIAESTPDEIELKEVLGPYLEDKPAETEAEPETEPEHKKKARHGRKPTWDTGKAQALWSGGWKIDDIIDDLQHGSRPVPSSAAIKTYINNHPEMFPERKGGGSEVHSGN